MDVTRTIQTWIVKADMFLYDFANAAPWLLGIIIFVLIVGVIALLSWHEPQ